MYLFVLPILALSVATTNCAQGKTDTYVAPPETKDRLSVEAMDQLVAGPVDVLQSKGLLDAERQFARLKEDTSRKYGPTSLAVADLEMSFGIALFQRAMEVSEDAPEGNASTGDGDGLKTAAISHFESAADAYTKHFGRQHPETAVALMTLADAMGEVSDGGRIEERMPLIRETLLIRRATLGVADLETLATEKDLARLLSHPTRDDRKGFEEALSLADHVINLAPSEAPPGHQDSRERAELVKAVVLIRLGRNEEALTLAKKVAAKLDSGEIDGAYCVPIYSHLDRVVEAFRNANDEVRADALDANNVSKCLSSFVLGVEDIIN